MTKTCEVVTEWGDGGSLNSNTYCGKPAVWRYKTIDGGFKYMCGLHALTHYPYAEPIPDEQPAA